MRHLTAVLATVATLTATHLASAATTSCAAGDVRGLDPAASSIVVDMVCAAARSEADRKDAVASFRVSAFRLDRTVSVRLDGEVEGRHGSSALQLGSLDDLPFVAPRLAAAVVHGEPIGRTQRYDNLTHDDARDPQKKPSEGFVLGSLYVGALAAQGATYSGAGLGYRREGRDLALVIDGRFSFGEGSGNKRADVGSLSIGGRYLFGDRDFAPFVGGGLGYVWTELTRSDGTSGERYEGSSMAPYLEGGVTIGRLSRFRLDLVARVDLPLARATMQRYDSWSGYGTPVRSSPSYEWHAPVSIGLAAGF